MGGGSLSANGSAAPAGESIWPEVVWADVPIGLSTRYAGAPSFRTQIGRIQVYLPRGVTDDLEVARAVFAQLHAQARERHLNGYFALDIAGEQRDFWLEYGGCMTAVIPWEDKYPESKS